MPFINSKVTKVLKEAEKENIKKRLGETIELIPGKSENWLMVGFEDNLDLYFRGNKDEDTAFVEVKIFGKTSNEIYDMLTEKITDIFSEEANIARERIYVKYEEVDHWGWNGKNF